MELSYFRWKLCNYSGKFSFEFYWILECSTKSIGIYSTLLIELLIISQNLNSSTQNTLAWNVYWRHFRIHGGKWFRMTIIKGLWLISVRNMAIKLYTQCTVDCMHVVGSFSEWNGFENQCSCYFRPVYPARCERNKPTDTSHLKHVLNTPNNNTLNLSHCWMFPSLLWIELSIHIPIILITRGNVSIHFILDNFFLFDENRELLWLKFSLSLLTF